PHEVAPAAGILRRWNPLRIDSFEAHRIGETKHLTLADELEVEVADLAVEVRAVVLTDVGAEEAVGAVRRRDLAHAAQRRYVGPVQILLVVAEAQTELRGPVHVLRTFDDRQALLEEMLRVLRRDQARRRADPVILIRVDAKIAIDTAPIQHRDVQVEGGI